MSAFNKKTEEYDSDDENVPVESTVVAETEPEEDTTLSNSDVTTKYQESARIVNAVLAETLAACVAGARVYDLCVAGDKSIEEKCSTIFQKKVRGKAIEKGVAFPVCVSVNEIVCNMSPLNDDDAPGMVLAVDDIVKVDLGVHVDGYIAVGAHTIIVGATANAEVPITGTRANVFNAAQTVAKVVSKTIAEGNTGKTVTEAANKVLEAYPGVKSVQGVSMHQMKRYIIDGNKTVVIRPVEDSGKTDNCTFEKFEAYAVDICLTSGEGKSKEGAARTTVYKRNVDRTYQLRMQASRKIFNEINKKVPTMPFTMRALEDEKSAKLGIRELVVNELLATYPVVYEQSGDVVVHLRFTLLLLPSGTAKVTGMDVSSDMFAPAVPLKDIDETLDTLCSQPDKKKKKKNNKKKAAAASA